MTLLEVHLYQPDKTPYVSMLIMSDGTVKYNLHINAGGVKAIEFMLQKKRFLVLTAMLFGMRRTILRFHTLHIIAHGVNQHAEIGALKHEMVKFSQRQVEMCMRVHYSATQGLADVHNSKSA